MGNFRHYVKSISSGNDFFTLGKKLNAFIYGLSIYQFIQAIMYFIINDIALLIFNVVAALFLLLFVRPLINKKNFASATIIIISEIVLWSFVSTLFTGMDTGFAFYDVVMITACFYMTFVVEAFQKKEFIPFIFSIILVLCYIFNYVMMIFSDPLHPIEDIVWIRIFFFSNIIVGFALIIIFSFLLVWEIRLSNNKLAEQNALLNDLAHRDPLTRLYNRRSMNKFLDQALDNLKVKGKRFTLILGDIDDFKKVNDTYGHEAGDIVLTTVAKIITDGVGEGDYVCRWGGEEILLLINEPVESASLAAERIRKHLEEAIISNGGVDIQVTMTFGVAESIPGYRIEHLIQQADDKLYEGKKAGKNRVVL